MPALEKLPNGRFQFTAHGEPILLRAVELQNSSFSSPEYMAEVWPRLVQAHANFALVAVTWEQIEPREGRFDFQFLDRGIDDAHRHGIKLGLLWFGAFKNGMSSYAPPWVKKDSGRFPRVLIGKGEPTEVLSLFGTESQEADSRAFAALMAHVKQIDLGQTVIIAQVENEVGILDDSRDRSPHAQAAFESAVPRELLDTLDAHWDSLHPALKANTRSRKNEGRNWAEVFGESRQTDEIFMAYYYAKYIDYVARAGKIEYDIPLYTNAWLRPPPSDRIASSGAPTGGFYPGQYPSGGPIETVIDIYQLLATSLAFIAPDIYTYAFEDIFEIYSHRGQPLFIPEQQPTEYGMLRSWAAIGNYGSLACAPFGFDYAHLHTDNPMASHFELLSRADLILLKARQEGRATFGFYFDRFEKGSDDPSPAQRVQIGDWTLHIERSRTIGHPSPGYGLIVQQSQDTFWLIGQGFSVRPEVKNRFAGIASFHEKERDGNQYRTVRWLNGDETHGGRFANMPSDNPDHDNNPCWILVPARTRIAECTFYSV